MFHIHARRFTAGLGVVAVLALGLSACADDSPSDGGSGSGTSATVGLSITIPSLDPVTQTIPLQLYRSIYNQLTQIGPSGELTPDLATAWKSNPEATSWTFTIRTDAVFSDGTPVTADDVVFSINAAKAATASNNAVQLEPMTSVEKVGEDTIQFELSAPTATWPRTLGLFPIVPEAAYTEMGPDKFGRQPVGSGPYEVTAFDSTGNTATLEANPDYWGPKPDFAEVDVLGISDDTARANALLAGDIDVAIVTPLQAGAVDGADNIEVTEADSNLIVYLGYNTNAAPLDDVNLRKAIDIAIDRAAISENILDGHGDPASQMVASVTFGYDDSLQPVEQDLDEARALVEQSDYDGQEIEFDFPPNGQIPASSTIAQAISGFLEEVGVKVKLTEVPYEEIYTTWSAKKFKGMYILPWGPTQLDAGQVITKNYLPTSAALFDDPEVTALAQEQNGEPDETKRQQLISQIWQISQDQVYYSPLVGGVNLYAYDPSIVTPQARGDGSIMLQELTAPGS